MGKKQSGFTLIELSIVMVITGVLLAGALAMYKVYLEKRSFETTESRIIDVEQAIENFVAANGYLPCPAPRDTQRSVTKYGRSENCNKAPNKTVSTAGKKGTKVRIGLLPARTLGVSDMYMEDGYGNAFIYAVTEELTDDKKYAHSGGGIDVLDSAGQSRFKDTDFAQYALISAGKTGYGAYSNAGVQINKCRKKDDRLEAENCDDDGIFIDTDLAESSGKKGNNYKRYYDDRIIYKNRLAVLIEEEEEPDEPMCEQKTGFFTAGGKCPKGWEKVKDIKNESWRADSSEPGSGILNEAWVYNERKDGSEYFFTKTGLLPTTVSTGPKVSKRAAVGPHREFGSYCRKKKDNKAKQSCFTEEVTVKVPPGVKSDPTNGGANPGKIKNICPKGYTMLGITKHQGRSNGSTGVKTDRDLVTCAR